MKLSAITVCINYSDYLKISIEANLTHFDEWIIITSPQDKATIELCNHYDITCCISHECITNVPAPWAFNKGKAINFGFANLKNHDWILMLDADTCLPPWFRNKLKTTSLEKEFIYAADRVAAGNWYEYNYHIAKQASHHKQFHYPKNEPDMRVVGGYFQLFNWESSPFIERERKYVEWPPLGPEDRLFSNVWRKESWKEDPNGPIDKGLARRFSNLKVLDIGVDGEIDHKTRKSPKRKISQFMLLNDPKLQRGKDQTLILLAKYIIKIKQKIIELKSLIKLYFNKIIN